MLAGVSTVPAATRLSIDAGSASTRFRGRCGSRVGRTEIGAHELEDQTRSAAARTCAELTRPRPLQANADRPQMARKSREPFDR